MQPHELTQSSAIVSICKFTLHSQNWDFISYTVRLPKSTGEKRHDSLNE